MSKTTIQTEDKVLVNTQDVSCNGVNSNNADQSLGHPKVYLRINTQTKTVCCPYCGKTFIYNK